MSSARIVDNLLGIEQVLVVVGEGWSWLGVLGPLEQENQPVDGFELLDVVLIVERVYLLDLDVGNTDAGDQLRKHGGIRLDGAPLIEHFLIIHTIDPQTCYNLNFRCKGLYAPAAISSWNACSIRLAARRKSGGTQKRRDPSG